MIILKELLDKYEVDYSNFPKNILNSHLNINNYTLYRGFFQAIFLDFCHLVC